MATCDSDEDFISCHVCLCRYDDDGRKPKFLDCHHSFCTPCIKGLSRTSFEKQRLNLFRNVEGSSLICPTCRQVTQLNARSIDDLATNNLALRLVAIELQREKEAAVIPQPALLESRKGRLWCVDCESLASTSCKQQGHISFDYQEVYNEQLVLLEGQANLSRPHWEKAISKRQALQTVYSQVQESMHFLLSDLDKRMTLNDSGIATLQASLKEATNLPVIPSGEGSTDEEYQDTIDQMNELAVRFAAIKDESLAQETAAQELLNKFQLLEMKRASLILSHNESKSVKDINLLKQLPLSFKGDTHTLPALKACVSVLTFLILTLTEQESTNPQSALITEMKRQESPGSNHSSDEQNVSPKGQKVAELKTKLPKPVAASTAGGSASPETGARPKNSKDPAGAPGTALRSILRNKTDLSASKLSGSMPNLGSEVASRYYFRFAIDGQLTGKVIIELDRSAAPLMCAKFAYLCGGTGPGYLGSHVFKTVPKRSITGGFVDTSDAKSQWRRHFFYTADRSVLTERRGSIRMHINRIINWKAEVGTEFLIILGDRQEKRKFTTVFGHVVEGLAHCDKISQLNVEKTDVVIAECGPCS